MMIHSTCKSAIQDCLSSRRFAIASLDQEDRTMGIHVHDCCEIYYSLSGGRQFLIDNRIYEFQPGDMFFINPFESHYLAQVDPMTHSRVVLSVHPDFLREFSTPDTDLYFCFSHRDAALGHKISLTGEEKHRFQYYIHTLSEQHRFGQEILDLAKFLELMTYLNQLFRSRCAQQSSAPQPSAPQPKRKHCAQVSEILQYINGHLAERLTLDHLAAQFYLSSTYLCKLFKEETGTTINRYITAKRISQAKILLSEGRSAADACRLCGFGDYNNFLRSFTKLVGVSPRKYAQYAHSDFS